MKYPLGEYEREKITSKTGKKLDDINLEEIKKGNITGEDIKISKEMLRKQGQVAMEADNPPMAHNFERAAELVDVPDEVNNFIATKIESNIRELEGCLNRVIAYASLTGAPVSEDLAAEALRDIIPVKDPKRITTDLIMAIVAEHYGVTVDDLKSKRRNREVSVPRQIAMYLVREMNGTSLPTIGMEFGGKDHTTVIHACKKVEDDLKSDLQLKETVNTLKKRIQGA